MDPDAYVPAYVRRYPFLPVSGDGRQNPLGGGNRQMLCIDRLASNISERPEIPFFEDGQHSPYTRQAIEACYKFEELARRTRDFIRILEDYDLFEEMELSVPRANADGTEAAPEKIEDCLTISERKLSNLPADSYIKLRDIGIPGLAYAQLVSLGLWPKLLSRAVRINAAAAI
jgi:hypothetical protein